MLVIKTPKNRLFFKYLQWINPILELSKGEMDILASLLTLHYTHRHYDKTRLNELLFSEETLEFIRKKIKINAKLFNKLLDSLKEQGLITPQGLNEKLINYPKDGKFKLFIAFEVEK